MPTTNKNLSSLLRTHSRQRIGLYVGIAGFIIGIVLNVLGSWYRNDWMFFMGILLFFGGVTGFIISYFGHK
jgi:hypothetical protein